MEHGPPEPDRHLLKAASAMRRAEIMPELNQGSLSSEGGQPAAVGILLFPDVEVLDFAGPYEVFSVATRIAPQVLQGRRRPFAVITIAENQALVPARHGLQVMPNYGFDDAPPLDIVIVPGGVMREPLANPATLAWLRRETGRATLTASICTGAFLLAQIGLLDGRTATTHWEDIDRMRATFPNVKVVDDTPYVETGPVVTSAGIAAGIDMSIHLVSRLVNRDLAHATARQMQYDWRVHEPDSEANIPSFTS